MTGVALTGMRRRLGTIGVPAITLAHGGGGKAMRDLIDDVFVRAFANDHLDARDDQARFDIAALASHGDRLAFTTDSYVVDPIVFPGGDIGTLAVCGTVNDLAVGGATPLYLTCSVILEEGLRVDTVRSIAASMARAAHDAGVRIVTGDTKVVERGACDKIFINTAGIGVIRSGIELSIGAVRVGDVILVNGYLGDHGATVLAARGNLAIDAPIASDCAPLGDLVTTLLAAAPGTRFLRDATRGGVATVLNEIALASEIAIEIDEDATPLRDAVRGFCEILGLDPLYLANEGKLVAVVPAGEARASARPRCLRHRPCDRRRSGPRDDAHDLRRLADRRHARRRAAATDLLTVHELGIARSIVAIVCERAGPRPVTCVTLEVGRLCGVMPEAIAFCFPLVAEGTVCAGARLEIREPEGRARCRTCGTDFAVPKLGTPCACGSYDAERTGGDELNVKAMEVEAA